MENTKAKNNVRRVVNIIKIFKALVIGMPEWETKKNGTETIFEYIITKSSQMWLNTLNPKHDK